MMQTYPTPVLALEKLYNDVRTRFAVEAGFLSAPEISRFTGVAAIAGSPTDTAEVKVLFVVGGVVGVAGITYQVSFDDGATYGAVTPLGLAGAIVVLGVTLTISGAVTAADFVRWVQSGVPAPVFAFGTREPPKRGTVLRVCFVPGDEAGNAGDVGPARNPGGITRSLGTLHELFTIVVEAFDDTPTRPEVELYQWKACRLLWDAVMRAIYLSAHGTYEVQSTEHMTERSTRRHAWAMRSLVAIQSVIPDAAAYVLTPPNIAEQTATLRIPDPPAPPHDDSDQPETITP
jgi:hypothetical protein